MPPDETQAGAAAAIAATSRSPALPAAGGGTPVDSAVGVTAAGGGTPVDAAVGVAAREEVEEVEKVEEEVEEEVEELTLGYSRALITLFEEENTMSDRTGVVKPQPLSREEVDAVALGNGGPLFALFKEAAANAVGDVTGVEVSAKCRELRIKLSKKMELRRSWAGFENPLEEQKFIYCEKAVSADHGFLIEQTYQAMLDDVKKMEKLIKIRFNEFKNRDASLQSLKDSIKKLDYVQAELHMDECLRGHLLIEKVEEQRGMKIYEDPIVLCRDLDSLRKKIEKPCPLPIDAFSKTPIEDLIFNAAINDFKSFIGQLRNRFLDNDQYEKIMESYLLALQTIGDQPPKWLRIHLLGRADDKVAIYLRSDNGYFVAFENRNGKFELGPGKRSELSRLIPDSVFVHCDSDYPSMMNFERTKDPLSKDELKRRLKAIILNVEEMLDDIHILSNYSHPPPYDAIRRFQLALARIAIMICEVCRIIQVLSAVDDGWISGVRISEQLLQYIWGWRDMSKPFRTSSTDKSRMFTLKLQRSLGMLYVYQVASVLFLVLNDVFGGDGKKDEPEEDQPGDGGNDEPEVQPGDGGNDETEVQPGDGGNPVDESNSTQQPHSAVISIVASLISRIWLRRGGLYLCNPARNTLSSGEPAQDNSQQQPHHGSADDTDTSQQQAPLLRPHVAAGNEDATCSSSSSTSIRTSRHYSVHSPSQGLIDFVPYFKKPMAEYYGSKSLLSLAGQTSSQGLIVFVPYVENPMGEYYGSMSPLSLAGQTSFAGTMLRGRNLPRQTSFGGIMLCDWQLRQSSVCSPSRGLIDLIYVNNKRSVPRGMEIWTGCLVEIFEVSANFPFVGTIMICDERSSNTLYCRDDWDKAYCDFVSKRNKWASSSGNAAVHFKDTIELIGPSRATIADGGFVIKACIPATRRKAREICKLTCKTDSSLYNELRTYTMKTDRGCLHVTCSVMPEALEAFVDVTLRLPSQWRGVTSAKVYGNITARIEKFDISSTLFNKDVKEAVPLAVPLNKRRHAFNDFYPMHHEGYKTMGAPLTKSILAVPVGDSLHIKGTLHVCGYDAMPITINRRINIRVEHEFMCAGWSKSGECFYGVRMWLRHVF